MWTTFTYTLRVLVQQREVLLWALAFPILLSCLFSLMFGGIEEANTFDDIPVAVVENADYDAASGFSAVIDTLTQSGDDKMLDVEKVATEQEARAAIENGACGYIVVDAAGDPALTLAPGAAAGDGKTHIEQTILVNIVDSYSHSKAMVDEIAATNPRVLADSDFMESMRERVGYTREIAITANKTDPMSRYYYALLGFACFMGAQISITVVSRLQGNLSALGARRAISGVSRGKTLVASMAAAWLSAFVCLSIAFVFMRNVLGVSFGSRDGFFVLSIAVITLMATALGALLGAVPKLSEGAKGGILTAITCLLSLFAGLYGTFAMDFADMISREFPLLATLNPLVQTTDMFFDLYNYSSIEPFLQTTGIVLTMTAVFALGAALLIRRQRYESL